MEPKVKSSSIPFHNHTALLLSTALPYLQPTYRPPVELAMKFLEFTETLHITKGSLFSSFQDIQKTNKDTGLFGLINTFILDIEGLLNSLSSVCTGDEKEIISMFLNLVRIKNFYETYSDLAKMPMMFSSDFNSTSISEPTSNEPKEAPIQTNEEITIPNIPFLTSDLTSMLNEDQKETLNLLKTLFSEES